MDTNPSLLDQILSAIVYRANISTVQDLANSQTAIHAAIVFAIIAATAVVIWKLNGRAWAYVYVAVIPFLNWSFGHVPNLEFVGSGVGFLWPGDPKAPGSVLLHPLTLVTGMVFVVRDFVQREMGHRVLVLMAAAIAWSFYYSWPVIALASGMAFAISETADWLLFTFTKYRLSTRILLSSALAVPLDTTVFLYGAALARNMEFDEPMNATFNIANWIVFVIGKMVGAVVVSAMIRYRENRGDVDPKAA
ncbi:MAG: hypothetical protein CMK07_07020 [Ponticaulis sp.]|nr:hypothetical protein [Ponticaulis sp.]